MKTVLLMTALGLMTLAPAVAGTNVILVKNGISEFTLGRHRMMAVRALRENGNAHSFEVVSFHQTGSPLQLVPLFSSDGNGSKESSSISVSGGADCVLHDFRLVKPVGGKPAQLVIADRDMGESFADSETVRFTYYDLVEGEKNAIGWPPLYFQEQKTSVSRGKFCDVNEAFDKELRLGPGSGNPMERY